MTILTSIHGALFNTGTVTWFNCSCNLQCIAEKCIVKEIAEWTDIMYMVQLT